MIIAVILLFPLVLCGQRMYNKVSFSIGEKYENLSQKGSEIKHKTTDGKYIFICHSKHHISTQKFNPSTLKMETSKEYTDFPIVDYREQGHRFGENFGKKNMDILNSKQLYSPKT